MSSGSQIEIFLGHQRFDAVSDLYAPFRRTYLRRAQAEIETIDEIEALAPGAFYRVCIPSSGKVVPIRKRVSA